MYDWAELRHLRHLLKILEKGVLHRRFEISKALCSARAQLIVATAQRMIARRKTA